jgi:cation-transporting P-type ATPase C
MPVRTLGKRLAVNVGALTLGNFVFKRAPAAGILGKLTSLQALTSLGLSLPIARSAMDGLRKEKRPNADFLTVTSIVASLLLGNANSALMILALSDLAEMMTAYTIEKTRSSIKKMLSVEDGNVWKVNSDGSLTRCPIAQARPGDLIEVHTGEKILVDGIVFSGSAVVDQSAITGEFIPVERHEKDRVFAGTVVKNGNIRIEAVKVGDQTVVSRIVGMVEESELKKAPIQRYADRFSNYLVPLNFLLSLTVGLVTRSPQKALKMLVIDYSCGIKLSTATAFSAAINSAVKQGILIKGGAYIEQMSEANTVLLDKTGTITEGKPKVVSMQMLTDRMDEKTALALAMAAEETSSHPLAGAILAYGMAKGIDRDI